MLLFSLPLALIWWWLLLSSLKSSCAPSSILPRNKKKQSLDLIECSMRHHLLTFVFEVFPKLLNGIQILLFRCTSIIDEIWLPEWYIPTNVHKTSRATAPWIDFVFLSCCIKTQNKIIKKDCEITARFFFFLMLWKLYWAQTSTSRVPVVPTQEPQWARLFTFLDSGLCRDLKDNDLSVLPFNIFQQLSSLASV